MIREFIDHFGDTALSPYMVFGYLFVIALWVYMARLYYRFKSVSRVFNELTEENRIELIQEVQGIRPEGISAEKWMKNRERLRRYISFLTLLGSFMILFVLWVLSIRPKP